MDFPINEIIMGDCIEVLKGLPDNYISGCITDPPYNLLDVTGINKRLTEEHKELKNRAQL